MSGFLPAYSIVDRSSIFFLTNAPSKFTFSPFEYIGTQLRKLHAGSKNGLKKYNMVLNDWK
jgi:hypothetical protein